MRYLSKIFRAFIILVFAVPIILFSAALAMQDKVSGIILAALNRNISTRLDVGSVKLSFLRSFPKASVELRDVVVHSSSGLNAADFPGMETDTLLTAQSVFVVFHPAGIYRGNYHIESITGKSGKINLLSDKTGNVNYNIRSGNKKDTAQVSIDLERINLADMTAEYFNRANGFRINGLIKNGKIRSRIKGNDVDFSAISDIIIDSLSLGATTISRPVEAGLDINLVSENGGVTFGKSKLVIDDYDFGIEGTISDRNYYDLKITGNNVNISRFTRYLPEKYLGKASQYKPSGKLLVSAFVKGPVTRTSNPHVEVECALQNGRISYPASDFSVENISFTGHYTNGARNSSKTSSVSVKNLKIRLGSSDYSGSLLTRDFSNPVTELTIKGKIYPAEIKDFFAIRGISIAQGYADADLKIMTGHRLNDPVTINDFIDMQTEGTLDFNNLAIGLLKEGLVFRNVNGNLAVSDVYSTPGLSFEYEGQKIGVKGQFRNLPEWLAGRPVTLYASGDVSFSRFSSGAFTPRNDKQTQAQPVNFPERMILDINFKIDSLSYKTFSSTGIYGSLTYKPRLLTFKSLNLKALNGTISGNGFIIQNSNRSFISRGDFLVNGVDVRQAFRSFNNFGQTFIIEENISGDLSGSISVLLPLDPGFRPRPKELTAEGKYNLVNGALTNFEPVKKLSSFIELSELENIQFEKLENDFFIRGNSLVIPQMDVKSSAADLSVNGRHSFDNNYEYHVKILLSQLLSKKRKSARRPVTEFGAVKDDGLGRTSLLLKIENRGSDVRVGYDLKAVTQEVNKNIKNEKQALRTILNEEYGWYSEDPKPAQEPVQKKKFNITWEETDSLPPAVKEEEERGFRNLFRKK